MATILLLDRQGTEMAHRCSEVGYQYVDSHASIQYHDCFPARRIADNATLLTRTRDHCFPFDWPLYLN